MKNNRILYSLNVEDAQNVSVETIGRKLTTNEIKKVEDLIGNFIDWQNAIVFAINDAIKPDK